MQDLEKLIAGAKLSKLTDQIWICEVQETIEGKYTDTQYEWIVGRALSLTSTADIGYWAPGMMPALIRGVAAVITTALAASDPATVAFDKRINAGTDTGRVADVIGTMTIPGGSAQGTVWYKDGIQLKLSPSEELVIEVTAVSATGAATFILLVEPSWEEPANNSEMTKV